MPAWGRLYLMLAALVVVAVGPLTHVDAPSRVPAVWPAAGLLAGLLLTTRRAWRPWLLPTGLLVFLAAHLVSGYPLAVAIGFSVSSVVGSDVVRRALLRGLHGRRAALLDEGDVSRMIGAAAVGSAVAAAGYGLTDLVTGTGNPWLAALAAFGAHAVAVVVLLPLFLETPSFVALASRRERLVQSVILVGTTVLVFSIPDSPPVIFVVMPMFAWLAFRGTMREATLLLTTVGVIGAGLTSARIGPIWELTQHYTLPPELAGGVLQLFLLDSGLILLPLSVLTTTQRMSAARAARERETLERLVARATGTAVIATGRDGRVVLFNPGAETMLGHTAQDVIGQLPDDFLVPEELRRHASGLGSLPTFADICRASVAVGDANRLWWFVRNDGERRSMRMTLTAVPDDRGETSGYLATAEDVTEREAAHQALVLTLKHERAAVERLRELERVKAEFVWTVSHELRTPITSIMGYTEILEDGAMGELTAAQRDVVGRVDRNSRRLLLLVEDLLTLSQIESSRLELELTATDLREVVHNAYDALTASLASRSLEVLVQVPEIAVVRDIDPVRMERMLLNLLTNAVKFTPDGGTIEVRLVQHDDGVLMSVQDSGMGIPAEEQDQLFNRFFRSSTATQRAIQGTGLGLTIVQAIVTQHGGTIEVSSTQGQGTTFTVNLPDARQADEELAEATSVS